MASPFNRSPIGRFFQMEERGTTLFTEFNGALSTFMSMAYILAVNPRILADSGGPCVLAEGAAFFGDPDYEQCLVDIQKEFIIGTAVASMIGCFAMGIFANLPVALAPGMGLNAYFTYSVVGFRGTGGISYKAATTAVLIEGIIFFILSITGIRFAIVKLIPEPIKTATPAGIGAFLAHLGLQTAEGIGAVVSDTATAVTLGGCAPDRRTYIASLTDDCLNNGICLAGDAYTCDDKLGIMESPTMWLGILGLAVTAILISYKNRGAFIMGIGLVTAVSWFRNTVFTYFPNDEAGDSKYEYFSQIVSIESVEKTLLPYTGDFGFEIWLALFTLFYVDFLDTSGTLLALTGAMGVADPETGDFPKSRWAFAADALGTIVGSAFGLSPLTSYIESGAGVETGSRTGLTAVFIGFFFLSSIFFAPILASIPPWAIGGSLIIIGCLMCRALGRIKWHIPSHAISAFLTVIIMPLTYSIAYGLIAGLMSYCVIEGTMLILLVVFKVPRPVYYEDATNIKIMNKNQAFEQPIEQSIEQPIEQPMKPFVEKPAVEIPLEAGYEYGRSDSMDEASV